MTTRRGEQQARVWVLARGAAALAAVAVLAGGVPVVLVSLTRALPIDLGALAPAAWSRIDDGRLLLILVLLLAWVTWGMVVLSLLLEVTSAARQMATPSVPGLAIPQRLAATLVATVLVALSSGAASGTPTSADGAVADGPLDLVPVSVSATLDATEFPNGPRRLARSVTTTPELQASAVPAIHGQRQSSDQGPVAAVPVAEPERRAAAPTVQVERHDTLWLLAEAYLGAGERYTEIVALNRGVAQPDGRTLRDDGRLYPGWTLTLPHGAKMSVQRGDRVRVAPGDTLWGIAESQLGDPWRYPEIARANAGDLQPDGRRLDDPNLILPDWVLELPSTDATRIEPRSAPAQQDIEAPIDVDRAASDRAEAGGGSSHAHSGRVRPQDRAPVESGRSSAGVAPRSNAPDPRPPQLNRSSRPELAATAGGTRRAASVPPTAEPRSDPPATWKRLERASENTPIPDSGESPATTVIDPGHGMATLPRGAMLSALVLAGAAAQLIRRRRQFQRLRMPGEQQPAPSPDAREFEHACRAALDRPEADLLASALVWLAHSAAEARASLPPVRTVTVGADRVTLHLIAPSDPVLEPFRAVDSLRWVVDAHRLDTPSADRSRAFPALVTLGTCGSETVLLNLEAVGTLTVTGAEPQRGHVLRGLAAELAFGPAAALTERTLCLADDTLAAAVEPGAIGVDSDTHRVAALLAAAARDHRTEAEHIATPSMVTQPTREAAAELDPVHIVLSDQPLDTVVVPNSGCALIAAAQTVDWSGACLVVDSLDSARLVPDLLPLRPQTLSASATTDLVELMQSAELPQITPSPVNPAPLARADHSATDVPGPPERMAHARPAKLPPAELPPTQQGCRVDGAGPTADLPVSLSPGRGLVSPTVGSKRAVIDVRERPYGSAEATRRAQDAGSQLGPSGRSTVEAAPRILVLGAIDVVGAAGKAESTRIGRLAETAAFVLLHPGSRPSELQGALWPGRRSNPQTCRQMISRTRTWLGRTASGEPYLMPFTQTQGTLHLRADVGSDWADFRRLAQSGLADPDDTEQLAAALALVRGRPFGAVAARELPWADLHVNDMIGAITDVAYVLATRLEAAGWRAQAHAAALHGLRTESESQILEEIAARTAP